MQKQTSLPGYNSSKTATKWKLAWRRRLCCWTSGDPVTRKMGFFSTGHRCQSWSCDTISRRYHSTHSKVFSGLVCMKAEYEIKLKPNHSQTLSNTTIPKSQRRDGPNGSHGSDRKGRCPNRVVLTCRGSSEIQMEKYGYVRTLSTPCLQQGRPLGSWQARKLSSS